MRHPPRLVAAPLLLILLLAGQTRGASPEPAPAPADIEKAVHELGAADYRTRERASAFLQQAGAATEAPLRKALASDDPEVSERARIILDKMDFHVGPDTPKAIIDAIAQYKTGDREAAVRQLAALDMPGIITLLAIQKRLPDENIRPLIGSLLHRNAGKLFPALIVRNETNAAGQLLEVCAEAGDRILSHAAWLLIRGELQDRIARLKALPSRGPATLRQLVYLYRADGNLTNALEYAIRLSDPNLTRQVRYELGDWQALATDPGGEPGIERLGFQAAYHRLSGNKPAFEAALTNIHTYAAQHRTKDDAWYVAEAFLINDRPRDAVAALTQMGQYELACKVLAPFGHEDEVFRIISRARLAKSDELPALEQIAARKLTTRGSTNEARAIITNLIANTTLTTNNATYSLIGTAKDIGLITEAASLAASVLRTLSTKQDSERQTVLQCLFPEFAARAEAWLSLLRETATEGTLPEHLARLHGYFTARPESLREFISLADKAAPAIQKLPANDQTLLWQSLADAHKCLHETNQVVTCERRACEASASDAENHLRLALASANALQWPESAAAARRAYSIQPEPATLWASGWALAKAGDEKAGREAMDRASLLALANEAKRFAMIKVMEEYGANDAAVLQQELILRLGSLNSWEIEQCALRVAGRAFKEKAFETYILMQERSNLRSLYTSTSYADLCDYTRNVYWSTLARILTNLSQGHFEEAMEQARHQQELWPCDTDLPILLEPALKKAGRKDLADELFATTFASRTALLRQYPNHADGHNSIAWLCARMRRELTTGLEHARKALELRPDQHGFRDTLAEVLFQLGRRDEAVAEMRKCIEQAPWNQYYRRQLKRMQEADPSTDPSVESD